MSQTSVTNEPVKAFAGMVEYPRDSFVQTGITVGAVPYGAVVTRDLTAGKPWNAVRVPAATGECTGLGARGVAVRRELQEPTSIATLKTINFVRRGYIWVEPEAAIAIDVNPFVRFAAGAGGSVLGSFRHNADTATAVAVTWAKVIRVEGTLHLLEINF